MSTLYPPDPWLDDYSERTSVATRVLIRDQRERHGLWADDWRTGPQAANLQLSNVCQDGEHHLCPQDNDQAGVALLFTCRCLCHYHDRRLNSYLASRGYLGAQLHELAAQEELDADLAQALDASLELGPLWQRYVAGDR